MSLGICVAADRPVLMSILVPVVLVVRFAARRRLVPEESRRVELAFFAVCLVLGAFNDWSSVVRYEIYEYRVPCFFPELSTIPLWMLLYWGMILRFFMTLSRWPALVPPPGPRDFVHVPVGPTIRSAALKVVLELVLVFATRQMIYRHFMDPVLSWLPFAVALVVWAVLFRPDRHDRRLAAIFLAGGPLIEILYIQLGGLHHYRLGWIGGVPLWIVLWWVLAVLIWKDLGMRIQHVLDGLLTGGAAGSSAPDRFVRT